MNKQKHQVNILPLLGSWHGDVKTNQGSFFIAGLPKNISLNDHMFRIAEIIWKETHGEIEKNKVTISVDKFNVADQEQQEKNKKKYHMTKKKWGNRTLNDGWLQPYASNGPSEGDIASFNNEKKQLPRIPVIRIRTSNYRHGKNALSKFTEDARFEIYSGLDASICKDLATAQKLQKYQEEVFDLARQPREY